ncbi:unnamed protein product [Eruca vesicaria subsp. sativa]|uniref:non-specific serine/threonine protein kinase n=1 Tax=Eruca vesicaria subsp. sativa TaxID=29727 RepID=A0ABC8IR40_ERUVS|nr:unnamed protein product [Eruca vesicaria subsp. sativa]
MFVKLLTIVFIFLNLLSQFPKSSSQPIDFTYNGFLPPLTDISLEGIATVTPNGLLKLTNYTMQKTGHAFYTKPIRFKDFRDSTVSSFSTTFVLAIHPEIPSLRAYGMAFVIAPNPRLRYATASQYMGLFNITNDGNVTNHVFAIEFDTILSPKFNDTDDNHVGIDINSLISVESSPAGYWGIKGQFKNMNLISGRRMQVWVDYDSHTHQIDVTMAPYKKDKPKKPLVSIVTDLSSVLLQDMFVGFSSATGTIMSENYVLGWSFGVKGNAPPLDLSKLPKLPKWEPKRIYSIYKTWMPSVCIFLIPFLFISTLIMLVRFVLRRRRKFKEELEDWETRLGKNRMKFKDLYCATKGFNEKDLLGSGGFGTGNILDATDPKLGTNYDRTEVEMVLKLGLMCSHFNPHARPTMRQVLHYLSGDAILPDLSPLDLRRNEMMLEINHGLSETGMFTCGSSMVNSIVSASSGR